MEAAMAVEVVVEDQVDTQTGMMTIPEATQCRAQEVETILQPIPTGMNILGLKLQSKLSLNGIPRLFNLWTGNGPHQSQFIKRMGFANTCTFQRQQRVP